MNKNSLEFFRRLAACPELSEAEIETVLTAAGASELLPEGNRILAQLGLAATTFVIDSSVAFASVSRDFTSKLKSRVNGIQHRADIAKRTGIDNHLKYDHRPGARSSGDLALATSALIGAIYRRTRCFMSVVKGLYSVGILNQHIDQCDLMKMFKDEQGHQLFMHPFMKSGQTEITGTEIRDQEFPPLITEFPITPNQSGVFSFQRDFEYLHSEDSLVQGAPSDSLAGPWSRSLLTQHPGGLIQERQVLEVCRPFAQMHDEGHFGVNSPLEEAEECTLPLSVNDHPSVHVDACQSDGLSGQPTSQKSSTQQIPCKRKDPGNSGLQKRKSQCADEFRSLLCREAEIARALDLPSPQDTYFRPRVEKRLLDLGSEVFSSLCAFVVRVGGSQSLVALRAALCHTREVREQPHSVESKRWVSRDLAIHERFEIINQIQDNAVFLQILRYNHILLLYRSTNLSTGCSSDLAIEIVSPNQAIGQPKQRGNPQKKRVAMAVDKMMKNIFPDLEPDSTTYKSRRRSVLGLRKLGERLHILADYFGDAVLCLLHFDQSGPVMIEKIILATSDDVFESFVKVLDESQGDLLREISNAAKQAFEHIIYQDTRHQNLFALEMTAPDHILGWPKGSRELLSLLY